MNIPDDIVRISQGPEYTDETGIIYCYSREGSKNTAEKLRARGIRAQDFYEELQAERDRLLKEWQSGKLLLSRRSIKELALTNLTCGSSSTLLFPRV
jgi:hypothetical protein